MAGEVKTYPEIIKFIRAKDYEFVKVLGGGACGETVLLKDSTIDELFVCKKYSPYSESQRATLFQSFVREIKLLHQVHHENVVRVFNHFLYPSEQAGFILMEFVEGLTVDKHIESKPQSLDDAFAQTVSGFAYLEAKRILHRDIRSANLMIRADGRVKIIDLGFGKLAETSADFDKSISLNLWCERPDEFKEARYDYATEVYFIGKLFDRLVRDNGIKHTNYASVIERMCERAPAKRYVSFAEVQRQMQVNQLPDYEFSEEEMVSYRSFSDALKRSVASVAESAKFVTDPSKVVTQLTERYHAFQLEDNVPDPSLVIGCLVDGGYRYRTRPIAVEAVKHFLELMLSASSDKRSVVLANLHTVLSSIPRHQLTDDDIPF